MAAIRYLCSVGQMIFILCNWTNKGTFKPQMEVDPGQGMTLDSL